MDVECAEKVVWKRAWDFNFIASNAMLWVSSPTIRNN